MIYTETKVCKSTLRGLYEGKNFICQQGGTYSGKTFSVLVALTIFLIHEERNYKVRVIGQTREHLKDGALDDFITISDELKCIDKELTQEKKYWINGSTIKFLSVDKLGKAKGAKFDITFINEANYIKWPIAQQLILRTDNCTIIDFNPVSEFWFHSQILPDKSKKLLYKRTTYHDNPGVSEEKRKEIEALKFTDEQMYRVYSLGLTGKIEGLIFPEFSIVDKMPDGLKKHGFGLDFGFTNDPTSLVEVGLLGGELYLNELLYHKALTNQDISEKLKGLGIRQNDVIIADSAEPKSIEEIRRLGWNIKGAKKGKDSVNFGINLLKKYKLNVTSSSGNLIKELNNYKWKEKDGEAINEPVDNWNHAIDAIRYKAMYDLGQKTKRRVHGYSRSSAPF